MFKNNKKRLTVKGYMSLEASFIMPWVIFLFVFMIYTGFYLYDKCVLYQDAYTLCLRGSVQKETEGVLKYVNEHMQEKFGNKYFGTGCVEGRAEQNGQKVEVTGSCTVKVPFDNFLTMFGKSGWEIRTEAEAQILNPTKLIRKCRMAQKFIDKAGE